MGSESVSTDPSAAARGWAKLLSWLALLLGVIAALGAAGSGPLAAPGADPAGWARWAADRDALTAAFAVLRLAVLALAWYLLAVTVLGAIARLLRARRLVTFADIVTLPGVRRLLRSALGASLAASMTASSPLLAAAASARQPPAVTVSEDAEAAVAPRRRGTALPGAPPGAPAPAGGRHRPDEDQRRELRRGQPADDQRAPAPDPPAPVVGEAQQPSAVPLPAATASADTGGARGPASDGTRHDAGTWTVAPGEHFWSKAEQVLAERLVTEPGEREVAAYWATLVAANRDRLVDPGNPDLILPGQELVVPPPDPRGRSP